MDGSPIVGWVLALALVLLLLSSAAQAALTYIDRARLRHMLEEGTPRAKAVSQMVLNEPTGTLSTVMAVHTLALASAAATAFWFILTWMPVAPLVGVVIGVLGIAVLILVQFAGRVVAASRPETVALILVGPVVMLGRVLSVLLMPLIALEQRAARALSLQRSLTPADAEERIRHLVEDNAELKDDEREMIASVIELGEQPVRELMVPRMDVTAVSAQASLRDVLDSIVESGHSRIPVYEESIDNITGVVYAKDLLKHMRDGSADVPAVDLMREPYYIPETKKVDELLHEMQLKRVHLAVVVDEYGGTAGLISIEDLIEEIVGEIQDEYDVEEAPIERISELEAVFDARVSIRDLNDTLDLDLEDEDFDTVGGLVYHELGKVPDAGDEVRVDGCVATVLTTNGRRVKKVRVVKVQPEPVVAERT